jgi:hypothetical protein
VSDPSRERISVVIEEAELPLVASVSQSTLSLSKVLSVSVNHRRWEPYR